MTIETIRKKYPVDFACMYNDYTSTKEIIISMTDFQKRFEFDKTLKEINDVFYDNVWTYSDDFMFDMMVYFTEKLKVNKDQSEVKLLREKNEKLIVEIDDLKDLLDQNKLLIMEVLKKL